MLQPLALVVYEKLLPGTQLVNRLQDLSYRVQTLSRVEDLPVTAEAAKPMLVLADLGANTPKFLASIEQMKSNPATQHLPVVGFCPEAQVDTLRSSQPSGVTLLVSDAAIIGHLPVVLDQALQIE